MRLMRVSDDLTESCTDQCGLTLGPSSDRTFSAGNNSNPQPASFLCSVENHSNPFTTRTVTMARRSTETTIAYRAESNALAHLETLRADMSGELEIQPYLARA
jgi:hypothetical protein